MSRTVRIYAANLAFPTGWRADRRTLRHLAGLPRWIGRLVRRRRAGRPVPVDRPTILLLQEAKNLRGRHRVVRLLGGLFSGAQGHTPARAGSAIYARGIRVWRLRLWLLGKFPGTLPRWVTQGRCRLGRRRRAVVMSVHAPPHRSGVVAQLEALHKVRRHTLYAEHSGRAWVVGGDFNVDIHAVARMLGGRAYGAGIVGVIVSRDVEVTGHGIDRWPVEQHTSDHPAPWIEVAA